MSSRNDSIRGSKRSSESSRSLRNSGLRGSNNSAGGGRRRSSVASTGSTTGSVNLREMRKTTTMKSNRALSAETHTVAHKVQNAVGLLTNIKRIFESDEEINPDDYTPVLMEIVSAHGLGSYRKRNINASCAVYVGNREVHRTKVIPKDPDPVWTVMTNSLCILEIPNKCKEDDEHGTDCLEVKVFHHNTLIGTVKILYEEILEKVGEREEFPILPEGEEVKKNRHSHRLSKMIGVPLLNHLFRPAVKKGEGTLALRFREATESDFAFFVTTEEVQEANDITFKEIGTNLPGAFKIPGDHSDKIRVQPYPDPDRVEQTTWMTRDEISHVALEPSTRWVEAGYGTLGKVYLEIIACDNLPNMDVGAMNDFTDAFVGVVFEDTMVRTNVIQNDLDPRWVPWCTRAFAFNIRHPSSLLLIGVFDYDTLTDHDAIGRVVIETDMFESNTTYLLHFNLFQDLHQKEPVGSITIRLRLEWNNEAEAVKMSIVTPPRFLINVNSMKALGVLRYLCRGPVNMQVASIDSVTLYLEELFSYGNVIFYLIDVAIGIWLWRGRANISFGSVEMNIWFPIHSAMVFFLAVTAVERPDLIPAVVSFSLGWLLLSLNYYGSTNPSPWKRCKSVNELNKVMVYGHSLHGPVRIKPNQAKEASKLREELDKVKAERINSLFHELLDTGLKIQNTYSKTQVDNIAINTEDANTRWQFLKNYLSSVHLLLQSLCTTINMFRNTMNWRGYLAHQLSLFCVGFAVAWVMLPVHVVLRWVLRLLVWTLLGPLMKIVDIFLVHPLYQTREELEEHPHHFGWEMEKLLESEAILKMGEAARLAGEDALKLKDMRAYKFGSLSQLIPASDTSRFPCIPLPQSSAEPYLGCNGDPKEGFVDVPESKKNYRYVSGQRLEGHMIHDHIKSIHADSANFHDMPFDNLMSIDKKRNAN